MEEIDWDLSTIYGVLGKPHTLLSYTGTVNSLVTLYLSRQERKVRVGPAKRFPRCRRCGGVLLLSILSLLITRNVVAIEVGDPAPPFSLPWLTEEGTEETSTLFARQRATVLFLWDRGCPHCTEVALSCHALSDSLSSLDAQAIGVVLGPDDPHELADLLWDEGILVPHLWDGERRTAGPYGLGSRHLGIFVIDQAGIVRASLGDEVTELAGPTLPVVRKILAAAEGEIVPRLERRPLAAGGPTLAVDGRIRIAATDGAGPNDTGLFGEQIANGTAWLYRWDLKLGFALTEGIELEPWLRLSNEEEEIAREGAEQLSSRYGSVSLRARRGPLSGTLGAFPLRVSPLLLQRWDRRDAPPIGGASGCGCGAGAVGVKQYSLELLRPEYTFEGLTTAFAHRYARLQGWVAVTRWEEEVATDAPIEERLGSGYRRILYGGMIDFGRSGTRDSDLGLPSPLGLRVGIVAVEDDQRTLSKSPFLVRPADRGEFGWVGIARVGPFLGLSIDGERVDWRLHESGRDTAASAIRAGLTGSWEMDRVRLGGEFRRIRTDRLFSPLYHALTYSPNREGWRGAAGVGLLPRRGALREIASARAFYREVRETEPANKNLGRVRYRILSLTLSGRPTEGLQVEGSLVEIREIAPVSDLDDEVTAGATLDIRWEDWPQIDPVLHIEGVRSGTGGENGPIVWQYYLSVRILR